LKISNSLHRTGCQTPFGLVESLVHQKFACLSRGSFCAHLPHKWSIIGTKLSSFHKNCHLKCNSTQCAGQTQKFRVKTHCTMTFFSQFLVQLTFKSRTSAFFLLHCTALRFARFLSGEFNTMAVINSSKSATFFLWWIVAKFKASLLFQFLKLTVIVEKAPLHSGAFRLFPFRWI
jgi:hypothetical protein